MIKPKIAFVSDALTIYGGAERAFEQMLDVFPDADIFALVDFVPQEQREFLRGKPIRTSFIQNLPFARRRFRLYFPLWPLAIQQIDVSSYDIIISSSFAVAKGVITGPDQLHICLCFSPIRWAWDLQHEYLEVRGLARGLRSWFVRYCLYRMRIWDCVTAGAVDHFIAISHFIADRITKFYRRSSEVIHLSVDLEKFPLCTEKEDYYVAASRFVPYKRMDLIAEAFAGMPDRRLIMIGDGPELAKVRDKVKGSSNIEIMGYQPASVLCDKLRRAKAFVFAAKEDFGIAPLEAQACGTPVIAFGRGGALETIRGFGQPHSTGVFFPEQTVGSIRDAVEIFERNRGNFTPAHCRENAARFSNEVFRARVAQAVEREWQTYCQRKSDRLFQSRNIGSRRAEVRAEILEPSQE